MLPAIARPTRALPLPLLLIALLPQPRQLALQAPQPQPTSQRRRRHTNISRNECQRLPLHQTALNGLLTLGMGGHGKSLCHLLRPTLPTAGTF